MSRLTDLQTIFRGLSAPWAWSRLAVVPEATSYIASAYLKIWRLIQKEEEAVERDRAEKASLERRRDAWRAVEPVRPWREDAEYDAAMREWRAREPRLIRPPVK